MGTGGMQTPHRVERILGGSNSTVDVGSGGLGDASDDLSGSCCYTRLSTKATLEHHTTYWGQLHCSRGKSISHYYPNVSCETNVLDRRL